MSLQILTANPKELGINGYRSNLRSNALLAGSSLTVYNISQFAVNKILVIGEYGNEGSELIKTHAATAPTGYTVTLATALTKAHPKDTTVYIYPYDQVEFSRATTLTGSKSVLATTTFDPTQKNVTYNDTTNTTGYYFTRYKNSITSVFSDYSDGIPYSGVPQNTVGHAFTVAMSELNVDYSDTLTYEMMLNFSRQMLRLVRGKLKSWSKYQEYDYSVGNVMAGVRKYTMPTTIYDKNSNRSVLNVRVGTGEPLQPVDRTQYLELVGDAKYTTVATQAEISDTSIVLASTADLDDSGSFDAFVSGTKYTIEYTDNNRTTNTLSGIDSSDITAILPVGSQIWQNIEEEEPQYFNVSDGELYLWPMITSAYAGRNILMDFYTDIEEINSNMDIIQGSKYDMLIPYLKYKIRAIGENSGMENLRDPSYADFRELLQDAIKNDGGAEKQRFIPRQRAIKNNNLY